MTQGKIENSFTKNKIKHEKSIGNFTLAKTQNGYAFALYGYHGIDYASQFFIAKSLEKAK